MPQGDAWLARKLEDMQRQINELRSAQTLDSATISDRPGHGIRDASFNGTSFADPGTVGNYFGGDGAILGNIFFRPGSVATGALAHPVQFNNYFADNNATTFTVAGGNVATQTFVVPDGFDLAQITVFAMIGNTRNSGAGPAPFYAEAIATNVTAAFSSFGPVIAATCADGGSMSIAAALSTEFGGLTAGVTLSVNAWAAVDSLTGWGTTKGNGHMVASVVWGHT